MLTCGGYRFLSLPLSLSLSSLSFSLSLLFSLSLSFCPLILPLSPLARALSSVYVCVHIQNIQLHTHTYTRRIYIHPQEVEDFHPGPGPIYTAHI